MTLSSPWRTDFPALAALDAQGQTYLDNAATAQKPRAVLEALSAYYLNGAANVHRAQHLPADRATRAFEATRLGVARAFGAASPAQIVFTRGATEAFNLLAYGLERHVGAGDEIVVSALEHHANLLPWQQLAKRRGAQLVVLPLDDRGDIDLAAAAQQIGPRTRVLAVSQLSNVLGRWQPVAELAALARRQGAFSVVDGAQGAVHGRHDLAALGCDFYAFSSHKLFGPEGVGVLYGRETALAALAPWQFGGEMVREADYQDALFHDAPMGFEAGTPPVAGVIGLGAALDYLNGLDALALADHEAALHAALLTGLAGRDGICLLGEPHTALACFRVDGVHHADLAHLLGEQGIAIRAGSHCAMPLYRRLGLDGAIRVSLAPYTDGDDLQRFFEALDRALELLR